MIHTIEIYDPALCCSTGVCGPSPDRALAEFAGVLEKLKGGGVLVVRHNLAQSPLEFVNRPEVKTVLDRKGEGGLPLVFVDGELFFRGVYPTYSQFSSILGIEDAGGGCVRRNSFWMC